MKINEKTIQWLLEENNPSVRYFAMRELQLLSDEHPDLVKARERILGAEFVRDILNKQNEDGSWGVAEKFYTMKYQGTAWQLLILAELGVVANDRIKQACELLFKMSQSSDGGFSVEYGKKSGAGLHSKVIPCLTGNMTWTLIRLGYLEDERVESAIDWIVRNQRADDGNKPGLPDWEYEKHVACFSKHTCFMGIVKSLKALSEIPSEHRSEAVQRKIEELVEFILIHYIFKKSHDLAKDSKPGWKKFGFPLMYQTDILEILMILSKLDIRDDRMEEAISLLKKKQVSSEHWMLENTFNGKMIVDIEKKGEPSKWITLRALQVLKTYVTP